MGGDQKKGQSDRRLRLGFLVNPIAGMGGRVGLKGTDGDAWKEALRRGARPVSPDRGAEFIQNLKVLDVEIYTLPGPMGEDVCRQKKFPARVVPVEIHDPTTREDTINGARALLREGIDLLVFVGGDGTARDVVEAVGTQVPILGVPAGVKMFSAVFAENPCEAAGVVEDFIEHPATVEAEVMDIDEEAYRSGSVSPRLYGMALVPSSPQVVLVGKEVFRAESERYQQEEIARFAAEIVDGGTVILGPGSTVGAVAKEMGVEKTPLGVDIVVGGKTVVLDATADDVERYASPDAYIVVSPIGAQGYIFGRGNQQITPEAIKKVGADHVLVVATPTKLRHTEVLRVDTGDPSVDDMFKGYLKVITGYHEYRMVKVI